MLKDELLQGTEPSRMYVEAATEGHGAAVARAGLGTKGWGGRDKGWTGLEARDETQASSQSRRQGLDVRPQLASVPGGPRDGLGSQGRGFQGLRGDEATFLRPTDRAGQCSAF